MKGAVVHHFIGLLFLKVFLFHCSVHSLVGWCANFPQAAFLIDFVAGSFVEIGHILSLCVF